jgi:hypothetical protein
LRLLSIQMPCKEGEYGVMSEPARIRRLKLVPRPAEALERPIGGADAVRRYRLARMERVAERSPASADGATGPRAVPELDRRAAEGIG